MGFGERLRKLREKREWPQKKVAERAGISQTHLSQIEREQIQTPHMKTTRAILEAMNVNPDRLFKQLLNDVDDRKFLAYCNNE